MGPRVVTCSAEARSMDWLRCVIIISKWLEGWEEYVLETARVKQELVYKWSNDVPARFRSTRQGPSHTRTSRTGQVKYGGGHAFTFSLYGSRTHLESNFLSEQDADDNVREK